MSSPSVELEAKMFVLVNKTILSYESFNTDLLTIFKEVGRNVHNLLITVTNKSVQTVEKTLDLLFTPWSICHSLW